MNNRFLYLSIGDLLDRNIRCHSIAFTSWSDSVGIFFDGSGIFMIAMIGFSSINLNRLRNRKYVFIHFLWLLRVTFDQPLSFLRLLNVFEALRVSFQLSILRRSEWRSMNRIVPWTHWSVTGLFQKSSERVINSSQYFHNGVSYGGIFSAILLSSSSGRMQLRTSFIVISLRVRIAKRGVHLRIIYLTLWNLSVHKACKKRVFIYHSKYSHLFHYLSIILIVSVI